MILDYRIDVPQTQVEITSLDLVNRTASGTFLNCTSSFEISLGNLALTVTTSGENWTVSLPELTQGTEYTLTATGTNPFNTATDTATGTSPTYSISANPTTVNEGQLITFTVTTTGVPEGTELVWNLSGTAEGADFVIPSVTGTVTLDALGEATFTKRAKNDLLTEGTETFTVTLLDSLGTAAATSEEVTILDTSLDPTYSISASPTTVTEGQLITFTVTTTGVPDETTLDWNLQHITTNAADFPTTGGVVTIASGAGSFTVATAVDVLTEEAETFRVRLTGLEVYSEVVTISAAALVPTYSVTADALSVEEGSSASFTVAATNFTGNLYWTVLNGTTSNADFSAVSGSLSYPGTTSISVTTLDDTDSVTETFQIELRTGSLQGPIVGTSEEVSILPISDTWRHIFKLSNHTIERRHRVHTQIFAESGLEYSNFGEGYSFYVPGLGLVSYSEGAPDGTVIDLVAYYEHAAPGGTDLPLDIDDTWYINLTYSGGDAGGGVGTLQYLGKTRRALADCTSLPVVRTLVGVTGAWKIN